MSGLPAGIAAQSARVAVVDAITSAPVGGAFVSLLEGTNPVSVSETDADGRVELQADGSGDFTLTVRALGYRDFTSETLTLSVGEYVELEVRMGVDALPLEPLVVVASGRMLSRAMEGFERRRADPTLGGSYLTRAEIERRPIASPTELLYALPSVSVQPIMTLDSPYAQERNLIWFPNSRNRAVNPGACLAEVYVDGVRVQQSLGTSVDDLVTASLLEGVEVYPRAFAAPAEFRGTGECGVVLLWTKEPESSRGSWGWKRILTGGALLGLLVGIAVVG